MSPAKEVLPVVDPVGAVVFLPLVFEVDVEVDDDLADNLSRFERKLVLPEAEMMVLVQLLVAHELVARFVADS